MQVVRYKAFMAIPLQTRRELDPASLERLGVDYPHGTMVFGPDTGHMIEMSNEASDSLVAALPDEFELVDLPDGQTLSPSTGLDLDGLPISMDGDEDDDDD